MLLLRLVDGQDGQSHTEGCVDLCITRVQFVGTSGMYLEGPKVVCRRLSLPTA